MAHTHNQYLETHLNSNIDAKMEDMKKEIKKDITDHIDSQLESFVAKILVKLKIPIVVTSYEQPFNLESFASFNSHIFHSNPLHRDLRLPRVEVNKFDGSDPTGWVTQMEHYFSLHGITDDLAKLRYGVVYLDLEHQQWWWWHHKSCQGYVAWTHFVAKIYGHFDTDTHSLGQLNKLKQSSTMEECIAAFEKLSFRTDVISDTFF